MATSDCPSPCTPFELSPRGCCQSDMVKSGLSKDNEETIDGCSMKVKICFRVQSCNLVGFPCSVSHLNVWKHGHSFRIC